MCLDPKLRWLDYIKFLGTRLSKYINILKWLVGKEWGINPSQPINFTNATVVAQLLWGSIWFINASNTNFKILESITVSAYKVALNLPRSASNKTSWAISAHPSIKHRISIMCDKFILKAVQLKKAIITNCTKSISYMINFRRISKGNISFFLRWNKLEPLLHNLYK